MDTFTYYGVDISRIQNKNDDLGLIESLQVRLPPPAVDGFYLCVYWGQFDIPTVLYFDRFIYPYRSIGLFRQAVIPTGRYSDSSLFRQVLEVMMNNLLIIIIYTHSSP